MGRALTPLSQKLLSLLDDGEWHEQSTVVESAMTVVAPGVAMRYAESARQSVSGKGSQRVRQRDVSDIITSGQRGKTTQAVNSLIGNGRVERRVIDGKKMLRLVETRPPVVVVRRDGNNEVYLNDAVVSKYEVDLDHLRTSGTVQDCLDVLQQISVLPKRFPGIDMLKSELRDLINQKQVDRTIEIYETEVHHNVRFTPGN